MDLFAEKRPARSKNGFVESLLRIAARLRRDVPRDVFPHERVIWHIRVQRPDHVVPILVSVGNDEVALVPARFRIAHQVQPMPTPALSELRRRQQPIHHPLARCRRTVLQERRQFLRRRRQSDQRKINPPQPDLRFRRRRGLHLFLLQPRQNEMIHRSQRPLGVLHLRQRLALRRFPNPRQPLLPLREIERVRIRGRCRSLTTRPHRAILDPALKILQHRIRQLRLLRRHLQILHAMRHRIQQ